MKKIVNLSIFFSLVLFGCSSIKTLSGTYTNNSIEFIFKEDPNEFEYFLRNEWGVLQYSKGSWVVKDNKVYLFGFTKDNLKKIEIESQLSKSNQTHISIHNKLKSSIDSNMQSEVILNDKYIYSITNDTILTPTNQIKTIQLRSYPSSNWSLMGARLIDTLYSSKISINDDENRHISIDFSVQPYDFARVLSQDTLVAKKKYIMLSNRTKLRKR